MIALPVSVPVVAIVLSSPSPAIVHGPRPVAIDTPVGVELVLRGVGSSTLRSCPVIKTMLQVVDNWLR